MYEFPCHEKLLFRNFLKVSLLIILRNIWTESSLHNYFAETNFKECNLCPKKKNHRSFSYYSAKFISERQIHTVSKKICLNFKYVVFFYICHWLNFLKWAIIFRYVNNKVFHISNIWYFMFQALFFHLTYIWTHRH